MKTERERESGDYLKIGSITNQFSINAVSMNKNIINQFNHLPEQRVIKEFLRIIKW